MIGNIPNYNNCTLKLNFARSKVLCVSLIQAEKREKTVKCIDDNKWKRQIKSAYRSRAGSKLHTIDYYPSKAKTLWIFLQQLSARKLINFNKPHLLLRWQ